MRGVGKFERCLANEPLTPEAYQRPEVPCGTAYAPEQGEGVERSLHMRHGCILIASPPAAAGREKGHSLSE